MGGGGGIEYDTLNFFPILHYSSSYNRLDNNCSDDSSDVLPDDG